MSAVWEYALPESYRSIGGIVPGGGGYDVAVGLGGCGYIVDMPLDGSAVRLFGIGTRDPMIAAAS